MVSAFRVHLVVGGVKNTMDSSLWRSRAERHGVGLNSASDVPADRFTVPRLTWVFLMGC